MWQAIVGWVFNCVAWFESFLLDWGLAIIVITIIFRLLITPIANKQNKSSYMMNKLNPRIQEIKEIYAGDQQKISEETQKLYKQANYNPLTGCIPMLIQLPIFMALFQALRSIGERVDPGTSVSFYGILPNLSNTPWEVLQSSGFVSAIPYFVAVLIFGASMFVPTLINKNSTDKMTKYMMGFMAFFMIYIGCISPAGVLLFWDVSSIWQISAQLISQHMYKRRDAKREEELVYEQPVKVEVTRKNKKPRPTKKR